MEDDKISEKITREFNVLRQVWAFNYEISTSSYSINGAIIDCYNNNKLAIDAIKSEIADKAKKQIIDFDSKIATYEHLLTDYVSRIEALKRQKADATMVYEKYK